MQNNSLTYSDKETTIKQLIKTLNGLVEECEYSVTSGLPFNFPDGKGQWTQLAKAKALLKALSSNNEEQKTN